MIANVAEIRRKVARDGRAGWDDVDAVTDILEADGPTVELLILRGQLIQLAAEGRPDEIEEALGCYEEALTLDPRSAAAHEEMGHFLDAVLDDPEEAVEFFRKAIELGAGETASEGLREALAQLEDGEL